MDLEYSEEELLVAELADRLAENVGLSSSGYVMSREAAWMEFQHAGLAGMRYASPEERSSATMCALVVQALARRVAPLPYLGHFLGTDLVARAGGATLSENRDLLQRPMVIGLSAGLDDVARGGDGAVAPDAEQGATIIALSADGVPQFYSGTVVSDPIDIGRIALRRSGTGEDIHGATVALDEARLDDWRAFSLTMVAADLTGVAEGAFELALDYATQRKQFGVVISSFQAIQHILAEQYVHLQAARAATRYAGWAAENLPTADGLMAAQTAKTRAAEACRSVTEAAIQVHGGIGMTWDCNAHRFLRRGALDRALLGSDEALLVAIAEGRRAMALAVESER